MSTQCKPCIHLSMMWKLAKIHWRKYWEEVNSYKNINMTACRIDEMPVSSFAIEPDPAVKRVRKKIDEVKKLKTSLAMQGKLTEGETILLPPEEVEALVEDHLKQKKGIEQK